VRLLNKYFKILQNSRYKDKYFTRCGKDDAGHWFHFVSKLMKKGAEISSATAVCEPTDIFRKQLFSVILPEICCIVYLLIL